MQGSDQTQPPAGAHAQTSSSSITDALRALDRSNESASRLQAELTHLDRLATMGTLAASVAHEINNLLTPIIAYAQMAQARPNDQALQQKAIQKAWRGADAAAAIAQSMLGYARPPRSDDRGGDVCRAVVIQCIESARSCLASEPDKSGIKVCVDCSDDLAVAMRPINLQQVLVNLLLNASRACRDKCSGKCSGAAGAGARAGGGGRVDIQASRLADARSSSDHIAGDRVQLIFADNGPGMDPDTAARAFEPFATASVGTSDPDSGNPTRQRRQSNEGGAGLGLTICKQLIEDAGGTIELQTQPEHGVRFTITLPLARAESTSTTS